MSFTHQLSMAFTVAVIATLAIFGLSPLVQDLVQILNANIVFSAAIGLPLATTATLLLALLALQH